MKVKLNCKRASGKFTQIYEIIEHTPKEQIEFKAKSPEKLWNIFKHIQKWKYHIPKLMGYTKSSSRRKFYGYKHLYLKGSYISNKNVVISLKELAKEEQTKQKLARRRK